jgi:hypothetical protein
MIKNHLSASERAADLRVAAQNDNPPNLARLAFLGGDRYFQVSTYLVSAL